MTDDRFEWDERLSGFGRRVRGGRVSWVIQYRLGHKQRRVKIGDGRKLTQAQAREQARKLLAKVELGQDPAEAKRQTRTEARHTLRATVAAYLEARRDAVRPRTFTEVSRYLNDHWAPLHAMPLTAIKRADIALELRKMVKRNGVVAAGRARATLHALFSWAIGEGITDHNPVVGSNVPAARPPRDRVLTDAELAAIWNAAGDDNYGCIVKLLILTGQRRQEIGSLRWAEVDAKERLIKLPPARVKNGRAHELPLSDLAWEVLRDRAAGDYVFGRDAGFRSWSRGKAQLDEQLGDTVAPWTLHDIRRTFATRMCDLGTMPFVVEQILNHQSGHKRGPAGVYNHSRYEREVRTALALWSDHVRALVSGGGRKVVPMRGA